MACVVRPPIGLGLTLSGLSRTLLRSKKTPLRPAPRTKHPGVPARYVPRGKSSETHVSAAQSPSQEEARLPLPHEDRSRPHRSPAPARQGESASDRLVSPEQLPGSGEPGISHRSDHALPRSERLTESGSIREVFDHGQAFHGSRLVLFVLLRPAQPRAFGVVAGRKIGGAVQRNRAKRRLREAYRSLKPELAPRGFHLVLVARRGCDVAPQVEVTAELRRLWGRAMSRAGVPSE